tara:strand:- start:4607 stop:5146 length:540 start_codon:yes stop_codon:yes gene_type:complete
VKRNLACKTQIVVYTLEMIYHINYKVNKQKYRDIFYNNIQKYGQWHWLCPKRQELFWYQLFIKDSHPLKPLIEPVEKELGILGMNNYPRFSYQFPNTKLGHHKDEDNMVSININLMETTPIIHIEERPYPYECAYIKVGQHMHGVEPDKNARLILKFCLRHPWQQVYDILNKKGLLITQ